MCVCAVDSEVTHCSASIRIRAASFLSIRLLGRQAAVFTTSALIGHCNGTTSSSDSSSLIAPAMQQHRPFNTIPRAYPIRTHQYGAQFQQKQLPNQLIVARGH